MPAFSLALGVLGLGASVAGGIMSYQGQMKQVAAEEQISALQQQQMNLDAARQRREIARKAIVARGMALSNATNSGVGYGGSSGIAGGFATIASSANSATLASNQNTSIGNSIFGAQQSGFQGATEAATGQGISSFGGMLFNMAPTLSKVGSYFSGGTGSYNNPSEQQSVWGNP